MKNRTQFFCFIAFVVLSLIGSTYVSANAGNDSLYASAKLSEYERKRIFSELVRLQDSGSSKEESEAVIKLTYSISSETLLSILMEGYNKGWLSEIDG
ncbi:hypothetical protein [Pseudoalteromonas prydzensis]|uniref:hypothetical protein n=1 Tax=Pseudoalteromonas prydzensis TaxID=182141 RepID=UPI0037047EF2